nr:type I-E CRISPR-associated protein Cas6/Cse3/CasE [Candidatus Sigynarchaeota archaeon]
MYLSRLFLNPSNMQARRDISDCHQLHRTVMKTFGNVDCDAEDGARETVGVLHRLDVNARHGRYMLIVQSAREPDWSVLPDGYVAASQPSSRGVSITDMEPSLEWVRSGAILRFRLKANPTKKTGTMRHDERIAGARKNNGKRIPVGGRKARIKWLLDKGDQHGFEVLRVTEATPQPAEVEGDDHAAVTDRGGGIAHGYRKGVPLTLKGVIFDGLLRVVDQEKLLNAIRTGIGSGKAFGFGLLSFAPAR